MRATVAGVRVIDREGPCPPHFVGGLSSLSCCSEHGHGVPKFLFALPQELRGNINAC